MMRHMKKTRLYLVSGAALLMLLILPFWKLMTDVAADQTTTGSVVNANLTLARSITNTAGGSVTGNITRGETYNLKYTITPQPVTSNTTPSILQKTVSNLRFEERLPAHITILPADLPVGFSISGTMDTGGLLLSGNLPDISYTWSTEGQAFIADHSPTEMQKVISVAIPFKATISGDFVFNKATLNYTDFILSNSSSSTAPAISTSTPGAPVATFDPSNSISSSPLGIAGDYNAFIFGDTTMPSGGDIWGPLASGGTVYLQQMTINQTFKDKVPYAVIAGKDINFTEGTVYGNILYGGKKISVGTLDKGTVAQGVLISPNDFIAARTHYINLSNSLATIKANGTTLPQYGGLYLSSNSSTAVFDIKNSEFDQINWTNLDNVKNAKTILFNFRDEKITFNKGFALPSGVTANHVIFNFPNASILDIKGPNISGSIIAPKASLTFTKGGQIHGNVIAEKLTASSLIDYFPYNTELPKPEATATPAPTATPVPTATPAPTAPPTVTLTFPDLTLVTAVEPVQRSLSINGSESGVVDIGIPLNAVYTPDSETRSYSWDVINSTGQNVTYPTLTPDSKNPGEGNKLFTPTTAGTYTVTLTAVTSGGITVQAPQKTILVAAVQRSLSITGSESGPIKNPISLAAVYSPDNEARTYTWTVMNAAGQNVTDKTLTPDSEKPGEGNKLFTPTVAGTYTVTLTAVTTRGIRVDALPKTIIVTNKPTSLSIAGPSKVLTDKSIVLTLKVEPEGADLSDLKVNVSPDDSRFASITRLDDTHYKFTANAEAREKIVVTASAGGLTATHPVDILKLINIYFKGVEKVLFVGDELPLARELWFEPRSITLDMVQEYLTWNSEDPFSVTVNNGNDLTTKGVVKALNVGFSKITVQYEGVPDAFFNIKVQERTTSDDRF